MGGFECADHINRSGQRVNLLKETEHDLRIEEDYHLLLNLGIKTVREGICWSAVEKQPYQYDFSEVINRIQIAEKLGIEQIWDVCHFGYPDGLIPTHPLFTQRFVNVCEAFAQVFYQNSAQQLFIVPINEISFLAWHSGDVRGTVPFAVHSGFDIKYHLCKAAIAAIHNLKQKFPNCRVVLVEPLIYILSNDALQIEEIFQLNENQFQAMDIIAGRLCPELGGNENYLDILGFNYYYNNQWEHAREPLPWPEDSPLVSFLKKRKPLHQLLLQAANRYNKVIFISETGHFGDGRIQWMEEIISECNIAKNMGLEVEGVCIYPITDRPDWDNLLHYSKCGIFDLDENKNRIPEIDYANYISQIRNVIEVQST
jgi:beta-glucosidase/6-phospho-beta-glucosidase/beta-galactosidase